MENGLVVLTPEQLKSLIRQSIREELPLSLFSQTPQTQTQSGNTDEVLSRNESATFLGVSSGTLWQLDKRGLLKASRVGGRVLYRKSDLLNYLGDKSL